MKAALLALIILTAGGAAPAAAQGAGGQAVKAVDPRAVRLAEIVTPRDKFVRLEVAGAKQGFEAGVAADPAARTQDAAMFKAIWVAAEPEFRRASIESHPRLVRELADLYSARLTAAELDGLLVFYATPTGQKLINAMYDGLDVTPAVQEMTANGDGQVSAEMLVKVQDAAKAKAVAQITPADHPALEALARSVDLAKMQRIAGEVQQLTMQWVNRSDPDFDARLDVIMQKAVEDYLAKKGN